MGRNRRARWARWSLVAQLACAALAFIGLAFAGGRAARGQETAGEEPAAAPITFVDPAAAPFSSGELTQALLARLLPADAGSPSVRVSPAGAGAVVVQVGARSQLVTLGERTGPAAARVVALVIAELASAASPAEASPADEASAEAAPASAPTVTVGSVATRPVSVPSVEASSVVVPPAGPSIRLSVVGGALIGTRSEEARGVTVDADLALPLGWHALRLVPSAGIIYEPTRNVGTFDEASFSAAVARLLAGRSWQGAFDFLGGPLVEPYSIAGANPHAGVLYGAEALARLNIPIGRRARMVVGVRADAYANRVRVLFVDGGAYATPRLALGFGWGLAWDWPR